MATPNPGSIGRATTIEKPRTVAKAAPKPKKAKAKPKTSEE